MSQEFPWHFSKQPAQLQAAVDSTHRGPNWGTHMTQPPMIAKALLWHDLFGLFSSLCLHLFLGQHGHNMSQQGVVGMRWSNDEWIVGSKAWIVCLRWFQFEKQNGAFSRDMLEHQTGELPTTMEPVKPNQPTPTNVAVKSETWGWTLSGGCSFSPYSPLFLY